ncbi:MAG: HAMP domain-containing histidine kinase [Phycicoccus sp.]|nr:HAMP domain-containing histidine kinase [Phycicoccus sp.]
MTLRRRLVIAVAALIAVLTAAGFAVLGLQRTYLLGRVDAELQALATSPRALLLAAQRDDATAAIDPTTSALSAVYLGRLSPTGRLTTVSAPAADPELVPDLPDDLQIGTATTQSTSAGKAVRVRVLIVDLDTGRGQAVLAVPLSGFDGATRRLALTLMLTAFVVLIVLTLVVSWVDRLGLRPIADMTEAAEAITAGDRERRVPAGPAGSEAEHLGSALNAMLDATAASEAQMRRFVADASHELRTPLTTLQGYAALHAARPPGPLDAAGRADVDDAMRRMGAESARMRRLVEGLLELADLEQPAALHLTRIDLIPLVADIAADLRVIAPDRAVTVTAPESISVVADRDRLTQAIIALTANAVRHTPPGTPITIALDDTAGRVSIEVRDAGPGIPSADLPHVLERFYRVDRSRSAGSGGSGLGLAIVDAIARAHGGSVTIHSSPGKGTQVRITADQQAVDSTTGASASA